MSKKFQIAFIKSFSMRLSKNIKRTPKFPYKFSFHLNENLVKKMFNIQ
jgi:hypothetical protein